MGRARIVQVAVAVGGGCGGGEPEDEHEGIEAELAPYEPGEESDLGGGAGGEDEVD